MFAVLSSARHIDDATTVSANYSTAPFADDWDIVQTLGEGAFGEVKLLVHRRTHDTIAVKVVDLNIPDCKGATRKEVLILRMLKHENVIGFVGHRCEENVQYVFLEYAAGGELFDRIEPDVGMPESSAQSYFKQLIRGTAYLHSRGVTHRDLKPENLLLTDTDVLKISDFGMATIFRFKGEERPLTKRCGTLPYVAPEVLCSPGGEYRAEPADLWSCGVVLVAMLAGELPWNAPSAQTCSRYATWAHGPRGRLKGPFGKLGSLAFGLVESVLNTDSRRRARIEDIQSHKWCNIDFTDWTGFVQPQVPDVYKKAECGERDTPACAAPKKRRPTDSDDENARICFSQPEGFLVPPPVNDSDRVTGRCLLGSDTAQTPVPPSFERAGFSQPTTFDNMLLCTQSQASQPALNVVEKLVKRMTRFVAKVDCEKALCEVELVCSGLGFLARRTTPSQTTVHATDSRRSMLIFKATAYHTFRQRVLVDFRLSKGDGLDFKRIFVKIRDRLEPIVDCQKFDSWSFDDLHKKNQKCTQNINLHSIPIQRGGVSSLSVNSLKIEESYASSDNATATDFT